MHRRDFVKTMAISGIAVAASDLVGDLIAQTPSGKPLESRFKGLSDIALAEARTQGCSYADIRFTGVVFPVVGWWLYDIFYITPFVALPYLHTVNREIFTD